MLTLKNLEIWRVASILELCLIVGRPSKHQPFVLTSDDKSQRFAKLKELFYHHTSRPKNSTFNFTQPHPKPTHHTTSGRLTIWRQLLRVKRF